MIRDAQYSSEVIINVIIICQALGYRLCDHDHCFILESKVLCTLNYGF